MLYRTVPPIFPGYCDVCYINILILSLGGIHDFHDCYRCSVRYYCQGYFCFKNVSGVISWLNEGKIRTFLTFYHYCFIVCLFRGL